METKTEKKKKKTIIQPDVVVLLMCFIVFVHNDPEVKYEPDAFIVGGVLTLVFLKPPHSFLKA